MTRDVSSNVSLFAHPRKHCCGNKICFPAKQKCFLIKFRNISCFPSVIFVAETLFPSVCPPWETWPNIGRKQCFRNNDCFLPMFPSLPRAVDGKIFYSLEGYSIARLRLILQLLNNAFLRSNADISANRVRKLTSSILKFKLVYSEYKDICLVAIAVIFYMLCEIKEESFFWTPSIYYINAIL